MGYFSNGTEGMLFEEEYCSRCIHRGPDDGPGCPVMLAHTIHNYDQFKNPEVKSVLDILIPRNGAFNGDCKLFVEAAHVFHGSLPAHLKEWAKKVGLVEVKNA